MAPPTLFCSLVTLVLLWPFSLAGSATLPSTGGHWKILHGSTGVSAMHMQLLHDDHVVFFDRTDFGESALPLPAGKCRDDPLERALQHDCTAHAAVYDVATGSVRPLMIHTDTWCSSGTVSPDGVLVQTGGFNDGERAVRTLRPCCDDCDWEENTTALAVRRWYATNQILPDGSAVIVGGRRQFSYEFYPASEKTAGTFPLQFLWQTRDDIENNLYPFVHLNVDGNLFIFANNRAVLLDYRRNAVVKRFPPIPGGDPRNYPSSGSSVLLPLEPPGSEAEVLICGGTPAGSYSQALRGNFVGALEACGRIKITGDNPEWSTEKMPLPRVMGDMILLPNGDVLIINGASSGTAGWEMAGDPALSPVTYSPDVDEPGDRFQLQSASTIPRLYHSTAVLLRDGRVLVGGSNPHIYYNFTGVRYPTETSLEAFSPDYLCAESSDRRPVIVAPGGDASELSYGGLLRLKFTLQSGASGAGIRVTMVMPSFTTHSFAMNQRLLVLQIQKAAMVGSGDPAAVHEVEAEVPRSAAVAPPGYYMVFVVNGKIPSEGIWVHLPAPAPAPTPVPAPARHRPGSSHTRMI